jgi:hypothetical protein
MHTRPPAKLVVFCFYIPYTFNWNRGHSNVKEMEMFPWQTLLIAFWMKVYQTSNQEIGENGLVAINRRSDRRHKQNRRNQRNQKQ